MEDIVYDNTTIQIRRTTRNLLATLGTKDQSFDDIISNLIKKKEVENI